MKHYETIDSDIIAKSEELYPVSMFKFGTHDINEDEQQAYQQGAMWCRHGEWIKRSERLPTGADTSTYVNNRIWAFDGEYKKSVLKFYMEVIYTERYTHWKPVIEPQAPIN